MNCICTMHACKVTLTELQENCINTHQYDTEQHILPFLYSAENNGC